MESLKGVDGAPGQPGADGKQRWQYTNGEAKMKVRVLKNYQDTFRKVHLVNDLLEIDSSQFDARLHSEEVETKQRATNSRKRTKKTEPIKDEADV